jgi:SecD/SecF fusion protein
VRENVPRMPTAAFSQIVNRSMSEVLNRSLATSLSTLLPVLALLFFGGDTLKDFAFALMVGIASGAYSSIFIASPVLTHWKERERTFAQRRARILAEHDGVMPAYADSAADVEPEQKKRASRSLFEPQPEQVSHAEFEEMKSDLGIEDERAQRRARRRQRMAAREAGTATTERPTPPPGDGTEGGDGGDAAEKPKPKSQRQRNKRHGRPR